MDLYSYESSCGGLVINERECGSFSVKLRADYGGVAPQTIIDGVLATRAQALIAKSSTPAKRREEQMILNPSQLRIVNRRRGF